MPGSKFDYQQIDSLLHSRLRLAIVAALATVDQIDFTTLKKEVNTTDGNLSVNLKKLEEADYLRIKRTIQNRKTLSIIAITETGYTALKAYLDTVDQFHPDW